MKPLAYNKVSEEIKDEIVKFYYEHKNIEQPDIARHFNVSLRAVPRILTERGVNTRLKNRYTLDENYFESIEIEAQAYWLGLLYADGFVGDENYNNVVLTLKDRELVEEFKTAIDFSGDIRTVNCSGYNPNAIHYTINFSSNKMASDLRALGLYPGKSMTMTDLPKIPNHLYRHFIRGYFDGDGSLTIGHHTSYHTVDGKRKKYTYKNPVLNIIGTKVFLENLASEMPCKFDLTLKESHTVGMYYLNTSSIQNVHILYDYFYKDATCYLKRKHEKFLLLERR